MNNFIYLQYYLKWIDNRNSRGTQTLYYFRTLVI